MNVVTVYKLGRVHYKQALDLQLAILNNIKCRKARDTLLLLEHPPTFTIGRVGRTENLLKNQEELAKKGIHFEIVGRGGDITYHGPGQLVGYPIMDLSHYKQDVHLFLRNTEEMIIDALSNFNIAAERKRGYTGVWVRDEKIASIGIGVKKWITYHGFALNVNTDLSYFDMIVPCGIPDVRITSIKKELGNREDIEISEVENSIIRAFARVFKISPHLSENNFFHLERG